MPKVQNQITMRKVCIVIQSLLSRSPNHHSSYSQDREKHHTLLTLKRRKERCPRRNQRRAARAAWVRCEPSTPRRDPKTGELARSSRRRAQPFLLSHCCSEGNQACLPGPLCSSSRKGVNAFRASRQVSENSELFKKLDPGAQFH